jgi:hypothetical protein
MERETTEMPSYVSLKLSSELYDLVAAKADELDVAMIDVVVRVLAEHFKRPDLAYVPRKRAGRPRKDKVA